MLFAIMIINAKLERQSIRAPIAVILTGHVIMVKASPFVKIVQPLIAVMALATLVREKLVTRALRIVVIVMVTRVLRMVSALMIIAFAGSVRARRRRQALAVPIMIVPLIMTVRGALTIATIMTCIIRGLTTTIIAL